jgi:hypothetical protein
MAEGKEGRTVKKKWQATVMQELQLELKSLDGQKLVKERELLQLKQHARSILQQRNEVENIFLKCLEQVKGRNLYYFLREFFNFYMPTRENMSTSHIRGDFRTASTPLPRSSHAVQGSCTRSYCACNVIYGPKTI